MLTHVCCGSCLLCVLFLDILNASITRKPELEQVQQKSYIIFIQ